jgi:hypothetical protein
LAEIPGIRQDKASRIEQRGDLLLSTLQRHIGGLGGKLSLIVEMPHKPPVRFTGFKNLYA